MSDLQCPATIVLLTDTSVEASELRALRLARVVLAADGGTGSRAEQGARQLASVHNCVLEASDGAQGLAEQIEQLADAYRGESVALIASEQAVCAALGRMRAPVQPIILAVDSGGWTVLSG